MQKLHKRVFFILLFLAALGQVTSDLYLPSLPALVKGLNTSVGSVQLSVSYYAYGFALSQLIYGILSDGLGRRTPLLVGLMICFLGSVVSIFSTSIFVFMAGRLLQGLGAGAGLTLARSILRDLYEGDELAKYSSFLALGGIVLMAGAPLLGGYLQTWFGWQASFIFLAAYAAASWAAVFFVVPETNVHFHSEYLKVRQIYKNITALLVSHEFMTYALCVFFAYGGVLAWLTVGPILMQKVVGLNPVQFGWTAAAVGVTYAVGAFANSQLVMKHGMNVMIMAGFAVTLCIGVLLLFFDFFNIVNVATTLIPIIVFVFGTSLVFPNVSAGALSQFPKIAGIASSVFGCVQVLGGAVSSMVLSHTHATSLIPIAILFIVISLIAMVFVGKLMREQAHVH